MTITPVRTARDVLAENFAAFGEFFRSNPDAITPDEFRCQYRFRKGLDRPAREAKVRELAASWRVPVKFNKKTGVLYCEFREGRVAIIAAVGPAGSAEIVERQDDLAQRATMTEAMAGRECA